MLVGLDLEQHYKGILQKNRDSFLMGGKSDALLYNAKNDYRYSLVLLIRIPKDISEKIQAAEEELKRIEPDLYYYPEQDFHITVIDILKGEENRRIPENIDQYFSCIRECLEKISPFQIDFKGLTASDNAIMVCGYYDQELQDLRVQLRKALRENGLELQERYETISSHITIARSKERIMNPEGLLEYIEEDHDFGKMKVDSIEFSFHNWYDTKKKVLHEFKL